ncbi:hypothetical protein [Paraburkholderia sp. WC7.3g]|uniref:hypothetical protein n=1 Tax=Paraburkholderia sp. WC7.3g TaxID=2991070 RepID=UPI003D1DB213
MTIGAASASSPVLVLLTGPSTAGTVASEARDDRVALDAFTRLAISDSAIQSDVPSSATMPHSNTARAEDINRQFIE